MKLHPCAGTWSYDGKLTPDEWNHPQSAVMRYFAKYGIEHASPDEPFVWDGEFGRRKRLIWLAAAEQFAYRLRRVPIEERNLMGHSFGGSVCVLTAAMVPINRLVTVSMPEREDMRDDYRKVSAVGGWMHIAHLGFWGDYMQALGSMLDGAWGVDRRVMLPGVQNVQIPKVGHSGLLNKPELFHYWADSGVIGFLTQGMGA